MSDFDEDDEKKRLKRYINILYTNSANDSQKLINALEKYKTSNPSEADFCDPLIEAVKARQESDYQKYENQIASVRIKPDSLQNLHAHMLFNEPSFLTEKRLEGYSSDEWAQLMNGADTAFNVSLDLQEGIAVTALKEVLGDAFPKNFTELTLDEQETIINGMNAAQIAKFNQNVLEKAETLAELLPPHQLVLMAKNVDASLSEDKLDATVKQSLEQQRTLLQNAMKHHVDEFHEGVLETNPENASGVYDGAMEMLAYLENSLSANDLTSIKPRITKFKKSLEESIKIYDETQKLQNVTPDNQENIDKAYTFLQQDVNTILSSEDASTAFTQLLDDDIKDAFNKIAFPEIDGENNQTVSADEAKKLFMQMVMNFATQRTAVSSHDKSGKDLKEEFKQQLNNVTAEEIIRLIGTEECLEVARDDLAKKKKTLKAYAGKLKDKPKFEISKETFTGYAAAAVNRESLFLNRLATKFNDRSAPILHKMYDGFRKVDTVLKNKLGRFYTIPKQLIKNQWTNLPWSIANATVRVAAFTAASSIGWWAYAGYAAYSVGTMAFRMGRAAYKMKKADPSMTYGKFFKQNWTGITLGLAGTALSVIPGLGHTANLGWAQDTASFLRDHGVMDQVNVGKLNLGLTWGSVGLMGAGLADSTLRGMQAFRRTGQKWYKALGKSLGWASLNTAASVGTGIGCSYAANAGFNAGLNLCGDIKTSIHDGQPLDQNHPNYAESVRIEGADAINQHLEQALSPEELATYKEALADLNGTKVLTDEGSKQKLDQINEVLNKHGITLSSPAEGEKGDLVFKWKEQDGFRISESAKNMAETAVKDWTKADTDVYKANVEALKPVIAAYNEAHPDQPMDLHRFYRAMLETGCQAVEANKDTWTGVDQHGHISNARGHHDVVTKGFLNSKINDESLNPDGTKTYGQLLGLNAQDIDNIKAIAGADGRFDSTKFTPEAIAAIAKIEHHMQANGCIGSTEDTVKIGIGSKYLPSHAMVNDKGEVVNTKTGATHMNTYANGPTGYEPHYVAKQVEFIMHQAQEQVCMFLNPAIDMFRTAKGKFSSYMARIMGHNPAKVKATALKANIVSSGGRQ